MTATGLLDDLERLTIDTDFAAFLDEDFDEAAAYAPLRKAELVGRPVGAPAWIERMEARTGLTLAPRKRGPTPRAG